MPGVRKMMRYENDGDPGMTCVKLVGGSVPVGPDGMGVGFVRHGRPGSMRENMTGGWCLTELLRMDVDVVRA